MRRLLISALLLAPLLLQAQVYRTTDEHGNVVFTDTPPSDGGPAERIDIGTTNITPPTPVPPTATPPSRSTGEAEEAVAYTVTITAPPNETSIPMGPGDFTVSVKVDPALGDKESLRLFIDSTPWGEAQSATSWALTNIFRGAHTLTVARVDAQGQELASSDPVTVFVHRPSVNFKNRN